MENMVYCLISQKLVEAKQAIDIMKTGFYKQEIPVSAGYVDCHHERGDGKQASEDSF